MSSYCQIFAKAKNSGEYIELCCFPRSYFHDAFCMMDVPYEKIVLLSSNDITDAMYVAEKLLDNDVKSIKKCRQRIADVMQYNNSVDEKLEVINDIQNEIEELETDKDSLQNLLDVLNFLKEFLENNDNKLFIGNDVDIDDMGDDDGRSEEE